LKKEAARWVKEAKKDSLMFKLLFKKDKITLWQKIKNYFGHFKL
jgi:hypothetical protein